MNIGNLDLQDYRLVIEQEGGGFVWWMRFRFGRGEWRRNSGTERSPLQCAGAAGAFLAAQMREASVNMDSHVYTLGE